MIRSFHYAALTALLEAAVVRVEDRPVAAPVGRRLVSLGVGRVPALVSGVDGRGDVPARARGHAEVILDAQVLQKAFHELRGELDRCAETTASRWRRSSRSRGCERGIPIPALRDVVCPIARGCCWSGSIPGCARASSGITSPATAIRSGGCSHAARLTPVLLEYADDQRLAEFGIALTNLCPRTTRTAAELTRAEIARGRAALARKIARWKPAVVAFVGVSLYAMYFGRAAGGGAGREAGRRSPARACSSSRTRAASTPATRASLTSWSGSRGCARS